MKILGIGLIAFMLFLMEREVYKRLWKDKLMVSVAFDRASVEEGEEGNVIEIVENRKRLPLSMLKVKFQTSRNLEFSDDKGSKTTDQYYRNDVFRIGGGERITRTLPFTGKKRGYYNIKEIDLVGMDLFLSSEMVHSFNTNCYLYVYPKTFQSREMQVSLQNLNGEVLTKRHLLEDPFEYRGIREYQPFDDIRSVNWKATARTGKLKVNQKNYTALWTIRIYLNIEDKGILKKEDAVESSMQVVMGLSRFFLSQGICVSVSSNGKDVITGEPLKIKSSAGAYQEEQIRKGLARITTEAEPYKFCQLFEEEILEEAKGTLTLFVSPNGYDDFLDLLNLCQEKKVWYKWFYPTTAKEEPEIEASIQENLTILHIRS